MTQEKNQNLAVEIHRGHRKAMEQLVRMHKGRLFTYASCMISREEEAKDIIQEAFMKAYTALTVKYGEPRCRTLAIRAWLFRIVRHIALNKIRSIQRREKALESMVQQPDIKTSDTGYHRSMENHLAGALENLGPEDRELVTLRFIDDLSYAEVVSVVGMTESAIRGKIYRAMRKLRKMMEAK